MYDTRTVSKMDTYKYIHFLIVGTNTILDVIAKDYPSVKFVDRY